MAEKQPDLRKALRRLCGYIENGTSTSVTIEQDDATKTWVLSVSCRKNALFYADTIDDLFDQIQVYADSLED